MKTTTVNKRILVVAVALALGLSACTSGNGPDDGENGDGPYGTLDVGMSILGPYSCSPALTESAVAGRAIVTSGAYETLVQLSKDGTYQPLLAESWELADDGVTWTFHLREGVQFSGGYGELTASDVVYSLEQHAQEGSLNGNNGSLRRLFQKLTAVDDYTLEINTGTSQADLLTFLRGNIAGAAYIVSKKQAEEVGEDKLAEVGCAGTGPWEFVEARTNQYWEFKAVPDHWRHTPAFESLVLHEIPEEATRVAEFQTGNLDVALMSPDSLAVVDQVEGAKLMTPGVGVDMHLGFYGNYYVEDWPGYDPSLPYVSSNADPASEEWQNAAKVRRALSVAIDRQSIVDNLLGGAGVPAVLWGWGLRQDELPSDIKWDFNPDEAKQLLADAGYPDGFKLTLDVRIAGAPAEVDACQAIATMWSNIGLDVEFRNQPNDAIRTALVDRSFNGIVCQAVGDVPEPINQYVQWVPSTAGFSGGIEHPVLDDLIAQATRESDEAARMEVEKDIARFIFDNALDAGVYRAFTQWPLGPEIDDWSDDYVYGDGRILAALEYARHR